MNSRFHATCEAAAIEWDVPSLAVGVSIGGRVETVAVGCETETLFRVASITKPFTAALALDLLDPEASTGVWPEDVRVRHLLSHTSGFDCELPDGDQERFGADDDALERELSALKTVRRWLGVEQCWSYANTGYWLAGALCAQAAGRSYEDALQERLISPLGLEATSFREPELAGTGRDALAGPYPRARRPSGGLVSNVHDLLRFGRHVIGLPLLRVVHGKPVGGVYGLGLDGQRVAGVEVWGHPGSWGGFQSSFLTVPDRDAVFVGLTNSSLGSKALREIEDAFFEELLGERRRPPSSVELSLDERENLTGVYSNSGGWFTVSLTPDGLGLALDDGEYPARAIGERTFEITQGDRIRERFDFPLEGFGRFGSRLAERVE